ncbi:MAG: hypothetical protein HC862_12330 [Scytonema sp. RU_4_4]|nr:hypothetical protein [Scytonema sp. RU_4_4]
MKTKFFIDRKYILPRVWSNRELEKLAHFFSGDIANVSGWQDSDKEGKHYRDYFVNASSYTMTNYKSDARGFQGYENEIFLNLENELPTELLSQFDVVFNHTVLEHIYDVNTAFKNLCLMSRDIVIIVVPFLQQMHASYGDYWRFTPLTIKRMFEENRMLLLYLSFNSHKNASVYIFAVATKNESKWTEKIHKEFSYLEKDKPLDGFESYIGCHAIQNHFYSMSRFYQRITDYLYVKTRQLYGTLKIKLKTLVGL